MRRVEVRWRRLLRQRFGWKSHRIGTVDFGSLRRLTAISRDAGWDRGTPIDRYYMEQFLASCASDIRGRVLEIGDDRYTRMVGGDRVDRSDVLHVVEGNPQATIVADLTCAEEIESEIFDCIICIQTLQMIYDAPAALRHLHRILKPGGVLLLTAHGLGKIERREGVDDWGEYWRFTSQSLRRMLAQDFGANQANVTSHGNVLAVVAFMHGLAAEELTKNEVDTRDREYELLLTARAQKAL